MTQSIPTNDKLFSPIEPHVAKDDPEDMLELLGASHADELSGNHIKCKIQLLSVKFVLFLLGGL